jgi:chemotaxis protein CheZ
MIFSENRFPSPIKSGASFFGIMRIPLRNPALIAAGIQGPGWDSGGSGVQRKIFRVEQMFAGRRVAAPPEDAAAPRQAMDEYNALRALAERREEAIDATVEGLERELALARETIAHNMQDLTALIGERKDRRMVRAAGELGAAINAMEKATQKILNATEGIDDSAKSLGSALKHERGLAQDIQEHAAQIYEACNFQDLAGQRIAKVIATLTMVEEQIAAVLERCNGFGRPGDAPAAAGPAAGHVLVNGPKLDGDSGHANQGDIDTLFSWPAAGSR